MLFIAGQVGWDETGAVVSRDLSAQFDRALANVLAVLKAAGGRPTDLAKMTVYVTDLGEYRAASKRVGALWRARLGRHYPAMALVQVAGLLDPEAKVEIEAAALLDDVPARRTSSAP